MDDVRSDLPIEGTLQDWRWDLVPNPSNHSSEGEVSLAPAWNADVQTVYMYAGPVDTAKNSTLYLEHIFRSQLSKSYNILMG